MLYRCVTTADVHSGRLARKEENEKKELKGNEVEEKESEKEIESVWLKLLGL